MKEPRILIACEKSGMVRRAFRNLGWDAWSCDLRPSGGQHICGDVREHLLEGWDMMIAHPPCTYLAVSGMHWTVRGKRDPRLTEEALEFVQLLMDAPIPRICVENPVSVISTRIRKPDQIIQPWMFGWPESKKTCLWLKNLPALIPTEVLDPRKKWANQTPTGQNSQGSSAFRAATRARTCPPVARAMAEQWGGITRK
jgi:hypothetical protein